MNDYYVNDKVISEVSGLAPQTLRNMRSQHMGPPYVRVGRAIRYRVSDVLAWLESQKITPVDMRND